jgi:hypothetical protein
VTIKPIKIMIKTKISLFILLLYTSVLSDAQEKPFEIRSGNLVAGVTSAGLISLKEIDKSKFSWPVKITTTLDYCMASSEVTTAKLPEGGIENQRMVKNTTNGLSCTLIERFKPAKDGYHCEIEIYGTGEPWTTTIKTEIIYKAAGSSCIWAPWGDPRVSKESFPDNGIHGSEKITLEQNWTDPLIPRKFFNDTLYYGAPYFQYEKPGIAFCPFQWDLLCIPLVSVLESKDDKGMSIILNPDEEILDLTMQVKADGSISFNRLFNRISSKNTLKFSFDIVTHEADWRGGLRCMSTNYPEYFNPANPDADAMAGTGGYSDSDVDFDVSKMKKMAFTINWRASFDFPYMGMFIPPVDSNVQWTRFGGSPTSVASMQNYADKMKMQGFHVLSYFNVTEFGTKMKYPLEPVKISNQSDLWQSANDFLSIKLKGALLHVPQRVPQGTLGFYAKTRQDGVYFTWEDGLIMDCGEPVYRDFLLDQAQKHIRLIPASDGICIDRMDWLRMYNEERDDGISWYVDRPVRSLISSWKNLMKDLCPLMHNNNKVIFVNNHDKRLDLLKNTDGIFDEFTYAGVPLNLTALLCISKPALGWTANNSPIKSEGSDNFFQKYLYLGVYPMAPFPGNDHSIRPDEWTDQQYLDYGPLLSLMRGKKWVLEPHCIEVVDDMAKANLFKVPDGYIIPVVFGKSSKVVTVDVHNIPGLEKVICMATYPGREDVTTLKSSSESGSLLIQVPLARGCAMVKLEKKK